MREWHSAIRSISVAQLGHSVRRKEEREDVDVVQRSYQHIPARDRQGAPTERMRVLFVSERNMTSLASFLLTTPHIIITRCTIGITLASIIMSYINALPIAYRTILAYPAVALMNVMACRIYRNTKLHRYNEEASTTYSPSGVPSQLVFAPSGALSTSTSNVERGIHVLSLVSQPSAEKFDRQRPWSSSIVRFFWCELHQLA